MNPGWVAGSVRGRLLTLRRLGRAGARALASEPSVADAVSRLSASTYGRDVRADMSRRDAGRAVGAACVWHLRVLAGWLPPMAGDAVRVLAAHFELENIADQFARVHGLSAPPPYELGALAIAWPRLAATQSPDDLRQELARSSWGEPGATTWPASSPAFEARWAGWLADATPSTPAWAQGAAVLVVAHALDSSDEVPAAIRPTPRGLLGPGWESVADVTELAPTLPPSARWVLEGVQPSEDLWQAQGRWWRRVDTDAERIIHSSRSNRDVVTAAAARLVADAWRVRAGVEAAGRGRAALEIFDAVA